MIIPVEVAIDDLVQEAATGHRSDLLDFVKKLDEKVGDWDFTLALCAHFAALKLEHEREQAEDAPRATGPSFEALPLLRLE